MADIADLLSNSIDGNASAFEAAFDSIMTDKVASAIDAKYAAMYPSDAPAADAAPTGDE